MQSVSSSVTLGWQRVWKGDRRKRAMLLLLTAVTAVWVLGSTMKLRTGAPHLFFFYPWGRDPCAELTEKSLSPWQPGREEWWQKLCKLESDMRQIGYDCRDSRSMGNRIVCFDLGLLPAQNCVVYSFGIDFDFSFDDAMADYGCTVYSFDPSMNVSDHQHADRVFFRRLGLAGRDTDTFVPRLDGYVKTNTTWPMRRLSSIMKQLGHPQGSLTLLKIDIEGSEWDAMDAILSDGLLPSIPQVLIEWHLFTDAPPRSRYDDLIATYFSFKARGFHSFHWNSEGEDHHIEKMRSQTETSWANERFLTPIDP
ncbi:uncharacterized protein LOC143285714 [Babylonia areolata]|uniref:uncharacterized protein LOC143285714 n=1 Tax=Babylonia areolata TaxID=304850 RepID=UPI003FD656F9